MDLDRKVEDASWEIVGLFIPGRISVKGILAGASRLWAKHLAEKAAIEALEGVSKGNLKHIAKHLDQFRKLDPSMTLEEVVSLGKQIASRSENLVGTPGGRKVFEEAVNIGGKQVKVRAVVNPTGGLRSVHIRK